jgi:hypothetical protein
MRSCVIAGIREISMDIQEQVMPTVRNWRRRERGEREREDEDERGSSG